jgi:hypothetical protein
MGLFDLFKPTKTVLVVDGVTLNESLGMKGKVPPRNQLQTLRRLARFSQREKLAMVVVLTGTPLNKAPAGKKFEDITVVYSKSINVHAKYLAKVTKSKGAGAVLVSANAAAEKLVGGSIKKLRVSTFRKVFDVGGDSEGSERNSGNSGRGRPQRRRQQKASAEQPAERPEKKVSDEDAINELIDLVD